MILYLALNIAIIFFPVVFSFEKKLQFHKNFRAYIFSVFTAGLAYIIWDILATKYNHWAFNPEYITEIYLFGLPIEELLFFITVPYACLFVYENLRFFFNDFPVLESKILFIVTGIILMVFGVLVVQHHYTQIVIIVTGLFFIAANYIVPGFLYSSIYWTFVLVTIIPFLVVNYILTSLPVVTYSPEAINGIRFVTIPFEDFFYSFSMLSWYLLFYKLYKLKWQKK